MTRIYGGKTAAKVYRRQLIDLVEEPEYVVQVRGRLTREILNVVTEIGDPRARCQIVPGRKLNPWLALSECLWLLAGRNDTESLLPYNKRILEFSDDGVSMYGAYGDRMYMQIPHLIKRLEDEVTDRRAVLTIWGAEDLVAETKDPPCNTQVMFKLRGKQLHMSVINRSNDLHWGLHAVNLFQFGVLQEYIACRLGVQMGTQTHFSNSLHIYTDERAQAITRQMMKNMDTPIGEMGPGDWLFPNPFPSELTHDIFASLCGEVLGGNFRTDHSLPFLEFATDFLALYREPEVFSFKNIRHQDRYRGWMMMGIEFNSRLFS